jgi:hypothetical protein
MAKSASAQTDRMPRLFDRSDERYHSRVISLTSLLVCANTSAILLELFLSFKRFAYFKYQKGKVTLYEF